MGACSTEDWAALSPAQSLSVIILGAQLYRLGLSLPEIAKLLGHVEISTTEIYAETDVEMAAEAMKRMIGNQPARKWDKLSEDDKLKFLGLK